MNLLTKLFGTLAVLAGTVTSKTQDGNFFVNLYYETLCPDCQDFSREQLCPTWEKMGKYFKIDFVPYGNAETDVESGDITIQCQHGPSECVGNRLHSCALKMLTYEQSTKFICCMESSASFETAGRVCARKAEVDFVAIKKCADGPEGNKLHYENGLKTDKLDPPHKWVPWILFNGTYDKDDMQQAQEDLVTVLCKYLDPTPPECNEVH